MNKKEQNNKGFSLVELIIVIAIMAILVGVLAPQFIKYVESSRQSTDIQNASEIRAAVEAFVAEKDASGTVTVAVTNGASGSINVTCTGITTADLSNALSGVGLNTSIKTKSSGWSATNVGVYSTDTYKWTPTACSNSKDPKKDLSEAFK